MRQDTPAFTTAWGMGPLPTLLETLGGTRSLERVFQAEGLPLALAHDRDRKLPIRSLMGLFEKAAREAGDGFLGLSLGLAMQPEDYGPVGQYIGSGSTLRTMIQRSIRAVGYHMSNSEFSLNTHQGLAYWGFRTFDTSSVGRRHHIDHLMPTMVRALQRFLGRGWFPLRIEVEYERPQDWRKLEALIGTPITFGAPTNAIVFQEGLLDTANSQRMTLKQLLTWRDLRRMVAQRPPQSNLQAISEVIRLRLLDSVVDGEGAAELLGVARRTLQRQLALENLSYRELVLQLRMQRALDLIRESSEPLTSIALLVGYSELSSFTRAFQSWAGYPPSHFRR